MQDELDHSLPTATDWLQTSIDNREALFNDGTGEMKHAHKDFICIAAGNTPGLGATDMYPYAIKLSPAFRRRYIYVYVGYDLAIDKAAAGEDLELLAFAQALREASEMCRVELTISPNELKRMKSLTGVFSDKEIIESVITKFLPGAQLRMVAERLNINDNRWAIAFNKIAKAA